MALDRTEIVNNMLAAVGEQPTTAGEVATPTMPEVVLAVRILNKVDLDVQQRADTYARDLNVELTPAAGEIAVPSGTIAVEAIDGYHQIAILNGKLYDRFENTFTFTGTIRVNTVRLRTFTELPQYVLNYIMARATREYAERFLGEPQQTLRDDERRAEAAYLDAELQLGDVRMSDAPDVARAFDRQPPLYYPHL